MAYDNFTGEGLLPVPASWITDGINPRAEGWVEYYEGNEGDDESGTLDISGYYRTEDRQAVPNKQYYYDPDTYEGVNSMSETAIAYSTYQTYLMYRTTSSGTYAKVVDIKDYPDMVGDANLLPCTTLSDGMEKNIPGIIQVGDGYRFTANYTPTNYSTVKTLEGHQYEYALWLGGTSAGVPDGHNGKFSWTGDVRAGFPGKGVDEVQEMSITAIPSTDVAWAAGT